MQPVDYRKTTANKKLYIKMPFIRNLLTHRFMWSKSILLTSLVHVLLLVDFSLTSRYPAGFCQVFSYNIEDAKTTEVQKHFFTCCNNLENKACRGLTYQRPSRQECKCIHNKQLTVDKCLRVYVLLYLCE